MTPTEFKAWFEGFCEGITDTDQPTRKQWERIQNRVAEIDGKPVTQTVFVDRYWPLYPRSPYNDMYWPWHRAYAQCSGGAQQFQNVNLAGQGMSAVAQGMLQRANIAHQMGQNAPNQMAAADFVSHAQEQNVANPTDGFDSEAAMRELGRKDYSDIN